MAVRGTHQAEFVRISTKLFLEHKAVLQCLACIFPLQHVVFLQFRQVQVAPFARVS